MARSPQPPRGRGDHCHVGGAVGLLAGWWAYANRASWVAGLAAVVGAVAGFLWNLGMAFLVGFGAAWLLARKAPAGQATSAPAGPALAPPAGSAPATWPRPAPPEPAPSRPELAPSAPEPEAGAPRRVTCRNRVAVGDVAEAVCP